MVKLCNMIKAVFNRIKNVVVVLLVFQSNRNQKNRMNTSQLYVIHSFGYTRSFMHVHCYFLDKDAI